MLPLHSAVNAVTATSESTSLSSDSSSINAITFEVHPSVYHGGSVNLNCMGVEETFKSIVCEKDYCHVSPEVLHMNL